MNLKEKWIGIFLLLIYYRNIHVCKAVDIYINILFQVGEWSGEAQNYSVTS